MNVLTIMFNSPRQINYFCNALSSYSKKYKCRFKIAKDNSINSASLLSMLRIGINVPFDIIVEPYDERKTEDTKKCKEEIERWFLSYGNNENSNEN